jgi:hypothetical protein
VIDQAPALTSVTNDFDGNSRPTGAGYDIGADEHVPAEADITPPAAPTGLTATPLAGRHQIRGMPPIADAL